MHVRPLSEYRLQRSLLIYVLITVIGCGCCCSAWMGSSFGPQVRFTYHFPEGFTGGFRGGQAHSKGPWWNEGYPRSVVCSVQRDGRVQGEGCNLFQGLPPGLTATYNPSLWTIGGRPISQEVFAENWHYSDDRKALFWGSKEDLDRWRELRQPLGMLPPE